MNLNKVFLIGRLTQEVDFKFLPSGSAIANLTLATNRSYKDKNGNIAEETEFHRVVAWGKLAELCHKYLNKGRLIFVEGRIRSRSWVDNSGVKRVAYEIIAENISFGPRNAVIEAEKELESLETELDSFKLDNDSDIDTLDISY